MDIMHIFYLVTENVDWMVITNISILIFTFVSLFYYSSLSKLPKRAWLSLASVVVVFLMAEITRMLTLIFPDSPQIGILTIITSFGAYAFACYLICFDVLKRQRNKILFGITTTLFLGILVLAFLLSQLYGYFYSPIWLLTSLLLIVKTIDILRTHIKRFNFTSEKKYLVTIFTLYFLYVLLSVLSYVFPLKTFIDALIVPDSVKFVNTLEIFKTLTMFVTFTLVITHKSKKEDEIHLFGATTFVSKLFGYILLGILLLLLIITNIFSSFRQREMTEQVHSKVQQIADISGINEFPEKYLFNPNGYEELVEEYSVRFQKVLKSSQDFNSIYILGEEKSKFFYYLYVEEAKVIKSDHVSSNVMFYEGDTGKIIEAIEGSTYKIQYPYIEKGIEKLSFFHPDITDLGDIVLGVDLNLDTWVQEIYKARAFVLLLGLAVTLMTLVGFENVIRSKRNASRIEASETKYRKIFNSASNAIVILTEEDRKIVNCNSMSIEMFGYTKSELKGSLFDTYIARSSRLIFSSILDSFISGSKDLKSIKMKKGKGSYFIANLKIMKYRTRENKYIQIIIEDITKEAELLNESQNYISELEKLNKLMIGRELRMIELKKEITSLKDKYERK